MPRYEMTISGGERIIVDHPGEGMQAFMSDLQTSDFLLLKEIRGVSATGAQHELIVASRQVTLVRSVDSDSRQSTTFRPKR